MSPRSKVFWGGSRVVSSGERDDRTLKRLVAFIFIGLDDLQVRPDTRKDDTHDLFIYQDIFRRAFEFS
jgi:hypothetical protein